MQNQPSSAPTLSVTVLNYNYGHYLPTCLDSILKQTFTDFEVILINDKSTDNSLEIIQPYLADPRVRLVDHVENKGFVRSLIEGCDLSRGKYITVISADDWSVDSTAFEKQIAVMERDPKIAFVYTTYGYYSDEQHCTYIRRPATANFVHSGREAFHELVLDRYPHHSGTIIRKTAYDTIGGYDPNLRYSVDAQMWLGLCHVGKVAYINEVLYAYRYHGENMSRNATAVRKSINEVLQLLDWSFSLLPATERRELEWLYKKAVRKSLSVYPLGYVFQNSYRVAWSYFWIAVKMRPFQTLYQKATIILILRTLLGPSYQRIERLKELIGSKNHNRLASEAPQP